MNELINNNLVEQIKSLLEAARQKIAVEVNTTLLHTFGRLAKFLLKTERCISVTLNTRSNPYVSFRRC